MKRESFRMAEPFCDICHSRPAQWQVILIQDGRRRKLRLCPVDYDRIQRERAFRSPMEELFSEQPLSEFLGARDFPRSFEERSSQLGTPLPRHREAIDIDQYLSAHTKELIQIAAQQAVTFQKREVDTEHLLLALLQSDVIKELFRQFRLSPDDIKTHLEQHAPHGTRKRPHEEKRIELGISPRIKHILEGAFRVARELGHAYIGPEHLLVAMIEEDEGIAGELLRRYGLNPEAVRQKVLKVVGKGAQEGRLESKSVTPLLDEFSRDLTQLAREGKLDPVIGRGEEIETLIEVLSRRTKNNPVLIGEPGVGKTAIVEGLAQRIAQEDVPEILHGKHVLELNINALVAGTRYRGEFEERIKRLLEEVVSHSDMLILFIDELHTIMRAGGTGEEDGLNVSNVIKPHLARGEMHLIGATTLNEYQKHIEKDAALERRFQPVFVPEPTVPQTIEILRGLRDRYEAHHRVKISDEAIVTATELSDRHIGNRHLPDKAIDVLDQAAARVRIGLISRPAGLRESDERVARLQREREEATGHKEFEQAKQRETEIATAKEDRQRMETEWREQRGATTAVVEREHVAQVISKLTSIPVVELTQEARERLLNMEQRLHERVIGQEEAITAVADAVRRSRSGLTTGRRPIGVFLFLGPTGVGKTELAKSLAWVLFGNENAIVRLDMSEYMECYSVSRLIGAPPRYVGHEEGGQLTEAVRRRPYAIVLLDEIEKAHPDVFNILLQIFDEGRLTDSKGRVVDFTHTILIATSNLGSELIERNLTATEKKSYQEIKDQLNEILRHSFRPEFLNRIDEIVVFHALTKKNLRLIVQLQLERVRRTANGQGIELSFDDPIFNHLRDVGYAPEYGARELRRKIQQEVETPLSREMIAGKIQEGDHVKVAFDEKEGRVAFLKEEKVGGKRRNV